MVKKATKPAKRRTQVKELPKPEKKLKADELKQVKDGTPGLAGIPAGLGVQRCK